MSGVVQFATLASALGCGLVSGVFFAFSTFVMPALRRLPASEGIAAMQSSNRSAVTPLFMTALFGTAVACLGLMGQAATSWSEPQAPWLLARGALYIAGVIAVTITANVPLNDALVTVQPHDAAAEDEWSGYVGTWTAWNHLRAVAASGAAAALTVALALG